MKYLSMAACALVGATVGSAACAETAATLLFTQPGTQIMDTNGAARPAVRGDVLQTGERLLTPPGAISQIKLPDGSLIGMRPDSELKINPPPLATDKAPPVVTLVSGGAHIIGAELMDSNKVSNFTFQSGPAVLKLQGADLESSVIRPAAKDSQPSPGGAPPGSYQRLLIGTGSVGNGNLVAPLAPREVSFVGAANVPPMTPPSTPPNLFASAYRTLGTGSAPPPNAPTDSGLRPAPISGATQPILNLPTSSFPLPLATARPGPTLPPPPIATVVVAPPIFTPPKIALPVVPPPTFALPIIAPPVLAPPVVALPTIPIIAPPIITQPVVKPCIQFIGRTCVR